MRVHTIWVADHIALSTVEHTHDFYQMVYCKKGGGTYVIGGVPHDAQPGHFYLIQPGQPHYTRHGERMRLVELQFLVEDWRVVEHLRQLPGQFTLEDDVSIRMTLKDLVQESRSRSLYSEDSTNAALALLLIRIIRTLLGDSEKHEPVSRSHEVQFLQLIDYIETHLAEPLTLEQLAAQAHFNKSYLAERFKAIWGISPMKYVNLVRVEKAKELLSATGLSIADISQQVGFRSPQYFSRVFKEKENLTPQQYRTNTK